MTAAHQANGVEIDRMSPGYQGLLQHVVEQLVDQLPPGPALPVLIPTVGFGRQNLSVLGGTVAELARQRSEVPISVVLLVNRPEARVADDTPARVHAAFAAVCSPDVRFAVAAVALPTRTRLGDLRQLLLDAVTQVQRLDPSATGFVIADDDLVHVPPGLLDGLHRMITGPAGADAALGPVLFDSPRTPAPMLPGFFAADALRALLAARLTRSLGSGPYEAERFGQYAESIALSGNLIVRGSALAQAGGFVPYNEITELVRGVSGGAGTGLVGTWDFRPDAEDVLVDLYRTAMRISARRALAAYLTCGAPSVAQWRTCRFRASRVDPVRMHEPAAPDLVLISRLRPHEVRTLTEELNEVLTTTLRYFPPDLPLITDCLAALGLPPGSASVTLGSDRATPVLQIRDPSGLLDRVRAVQDLMTTELDAVTLRA